MVQMRAIEQELRTAENRFSMLTDPDLIESEIYAIKCLQAKWRHLHKQALETEAKTEEQKAQTEVKAQTQTEPFALLHKETS